MSTVLSEVLLLSNNNTRYLNIFGIRILTGKNFNANLYHESDRPTYLLT